MSGTAWTPNIASAATTNHNSGISVASTVQTATASVIGLGQAAPAAVEVSFTIDMTQDLGARGSISLVAKVKDFPSALAGGAYPVLVSLHDGTNEYINLARAGSGSDCWATGYYICSAGICSPNPACTITAPSAYTDRTHWEQHQAPNQSAENTPSNNMFPTCNWSGGTSGSATTPNCAFNSTFFPASLPVRLRYGASYTAKYVLISDSYASLTSRTATIELTTVKRTTPATLGASGGAVDLNVFLVGDTNVVASRTDKGKQNLDTLISAVGDYFSQTNSAITLGSVKAVEWTCSTGGNTYSDVAVSSLGDALAAGSALAPAGTEGKAINIFLVSTISDDEGSASGFTILGFDGAIGGPPVNSTASSGLTVATFDALDTYNVDCLSSSATCPLNKQDVQFQEMGVVTAHEIGHFFGLNHLSESSGDEHDVIADTPVCTAAVASGGSSYITLDACLNTDTNSFPVSGGQTCNAGCAAYNTTTGTFCPTAVECSFNYLMWWTTKNFHPASGAGDGNILSADSGVLLNYNPVVQ